MEVAKENKFGPGFLLARLQDGEGGVHVDAPLVATLLTTIKIIIINIPFID